MKSLRAIFQPFFSLLAISALLTLSACSTQPPTLSVERADAAGAKSAVSESTRLGTQWGEGLESRVSGVDLTRSSEKPLAVNTLRYSAASGRGERIRELLTANGRVGIRVLKDNGAVWPIYRVNDITRLEGEDGERYILEYRNYSKTNTYEIIATVDGLDVLNGQTGSFGNRGYVLSPRKTVRIEGFRKSTSEVAAFRFSSVADSYAANSAAGSPANAGVIGTAVFELIKPTRINTRAAGAHCRQSPCAFPESRDGGEQRYASPPVYDN